MKNYCKALCITLFCLSASTAFSLEWVDSYSKALNESKKSEKPICVLFTKEGCKWCDRLVSEILTQNDFVKEVASAFIFCRVYFPKHTRRVSTDLQIHYDIKEKFQIKGFPTVVVVDQTGTIRSKLGYQPIGAKAYAQKLLKSFF